MKPADIKAFTERELRSAIGGDRIETVSVDVRAEDDGVEYLDIRVHVPPGLKLPTAAESIGSLVRLQDLLQAQGEQRFPNVIYVSADEAA